MSNPLDQSTTETRIAERINTATVQGISTNSNGALTFSDASQMMEFAKMMSIAQVAVPKHLRNNPGACLAVCIQASEWQMSQFSVANKSYSVNDRLAYESQLINAVILKRAPIKGRFKIEYSGDGAKRRCKVSAVTLDGETVDYESPEIGTIKVKNSPLWLSDPDQQLFYFASRSMCRRHFPDVLLGVYSVEEIQDTPPMRDVTPSANTSKLFQSPPPVENGASSANLRSAAESEAPSLFQEADITPLDAVKAWLKSSGTKWANIDDTLYAQGVTVELRGNPDDCTDDELREVLAMRTQLAVVKGGKK